MWVCLVFIQVVVYGICVCRSDELVTSMFKVSKQQALQIEKIGHVVKAYLDGLCFLLPVEISKPI